MRLSEFIATRMDSILTEWDTFARTISPIAKGISAERLRDHAREMLSEIAADMETVQSAAEQQAKSEGRARSRPGGEESPAQSHAFARIADNFTLDEVVSEYRALRATVIRLWTREMGQADRETLEELVRFNESIDQALCESIARYSAGIERARDLLLGALAHDLRSPLGAIIQSAHFFLRQDTLESAHTKAAARILNSGTRMKGMIADLLDFTRTRLGDHLPITLKPMDMRDATRFSTAPPTLRSVDAIAREGAVRIEIHNGLGLYIAARSRKHTAALSDSRLRTMRARRSPSSFRRTIRASTGELANTGVRISGLRFSS
jgi:signal transduction histidine kinase